MTQEEKKLLLKDLCSRLPYYTELYSNVADGNWAILTPVVISNLMSATDKLVIKPYLRPMSSMTDKEREEIRQQFCYEFEGHTTELMYYSIEIRDVDYFIDWLLAHHFDFRGLIEKDLALEALSGMYKTE